MYRGAAGAKEPFFGASYHHYRNFFRSIMAGGWVSDLMLEDEGSDAGLQVGTLWTFVLPCIPFQPVAMD